MTYPKLVVLLLAGLLALWTVPLAPGTALAADAPAFRIGVAVSLSGLLGRDGTQVYRAYEVWREAVNRQGGIEVNGRRYPVEIIYYDDESSEHRSAQLVERLITVDKVDLLLGGFGSNAVFAATAVAERLGYPYISGAASADPIFDRGYYYTFGMLNKTFHEVRAAAEVFGTVEPRPRTAAVIGGDHLFMELSARGFRHVMEQLGIEVVHYEIFPLGLRDYNSMLLNVRRKNPDLLLVGSLAPQSLQVMRSLRAIAWRPKGIAFSYGPTVPDFVEQLGPLAEGVVAASEWLPHFPYEDPVFGSAPEFARAFVEMWGVEPEYVQAGAAAGAVVQQMAVQALGITPPVTAEDRAAIARWMRENTVQTLYGPVRFAEDGSIMTKEPVAVQIQEGRLVHVYPPFPEMDLEPEPLWYPAPRGW